MNAQSRVNWDAVQAIGVILTLFCTWFIGRYQARTQFEAVSEQLKQERSNLLIEYRRLRRPILGFDRMTFIVAVTGSSDEGQRFELPRDSQGRLLDESGFPSIKNYGNGPALHIGVSYENEIVKSSSSPTVPLHCLPGESVKCFFLPQAINDPKNPISFFKGIVKIGCEDTAGERHFIEQEYNVSVKEGAVYFIFKEIRKVYWLSPTNDSFGLREDY